MPQPTLKSSMTISPLVVPPAITRLRLAILIGCLATLMCGCAKPPTARLGSATFVRVDSSSRLGSFRPPARWIAEEVVLKESLGPFFEVQCAYGQGAKDPYSYLRVVLRAFRGGEKDLAEFFRWSYRDTRSASAGPMNDEFTASLLDYWGDNRFAAVLTEQPPEVRRGVGWHLWKPSYAPRLAEKYPATAEAAMLKTCHNSTMRQRYAKENSTATPK